MTFERSAPGSDRPAVSGLYVYPVKSSAGISMQSAVVEPRGFRHDRRWMVVDDRAVFLSQRTIPALALVRPRIGEETLELSAPGNQPLALPLEQSGEHRKVTIWDDVVDAVDAGESAAQWFSDYLQMKCRLVYMPESTRRPVSRQVSGRGDHTSFADAYPFLLISRASLDHVNRHLQNPVPMDRFRPNIIVDGCSPFAEDTWRLIRVGDVKVHVVKPCARCVITTVDQETGLRGEEPLRTLGRLRQVGNQVLFGQNCIPDGEGVMRVGDPVEILEKVPSR